MSVTFVDRLPALKEPWWSLSLRTLGLSAYVRSPEYLARFSLQSGRIDWLIERSEVGWAESTRRLPRHINYFNPCGADLWVSETNHVVAEILPTEGGEIVVSARDARTGAHLWERLIPIPVAADWAESSPAWAGAQTEEVCAFFGDDPRRLVVCLFRESRCCTRVCPSEGVEERTLPPYACQSDAVRFDPLRGAELWSASFPGVRVDLLAQSSFTGIWSHGTKLGVLDFETGVDDILYESPDTLGWPVRDGQMMAVSWHSKNAVGVDWIDPSGTRVRHGKWNLSGVRSTKLHATDAGLALQTNDQKLSWLGKGETSLWQIRAKPYIYNVHCSRSTDIFVGTDGQGGRLFAFDPASGEETLNLKPPTAGAASMVKIPGYDLLVGKFWMSKRNPAAGRLCVVSMSNRTHELRGECAGLLGAWQYGVVYLKDSKAEWLAVADIRDWMFADNGERSAWP